MIAIRILPNKELSLTKLIKELHTLKELDDINQQLVPLKEIADRELASIYGLTGKVYTPHVDRYMQICIEKAEILTCLKKQKIIPVSEVEIISEKLNFLYKSTKNREVIEYNGNQYERRFSPLKLSKSGKNVQKWAKFWLLQLPNGKSDPDWESQVREIWPSFFLIRTIEL
ncbi:hypothetical protein [Thalassotalea profundi]|uniref:Uncharacterized protein n=1 Tax=Thalassotalea profundi TaxID=2036687 RepID=A0ABQ3IGW3_9GAMM|nr:hypothetical protein [Thalassotalea profundi]GHE77589.1 hypothetical protein GCM10011501_01490 [Thalassotalea profundi]